MLVGITPPAFPLNVVSAPPVRPPAFPLNVAAPPPVRPAGPSSVARRRWYVLTGLFLVACDPTRPPSSQPVFSVEGVPAAYDSIADLSVMEDGRLVVANALGRVVVLDATGAFLGDIGSQGGGPGEFEIPVHVLPSGDTLLVWDGSLERLSWFRADGELLGALGQPFVFPGRLDGRALRAAWTGDVLLADATTTTPYESPAFGAVVSFPAGKRVLDSLPVLLDTLSRDERSSALSHGVSASGQTPPGDTLLIRFDRDDRGAVPERGWKRTVIRHIPAPDTLLGPYLVPGFRATGDWNLGTAGLILPPVFSVRPPWTVCEDRIVWAEPSGDSLVFVGLHGEDRAVLHLGWEGEAVTQEDQDRWVDARIALGDEFAYVDEAMPVYSEVRPAITGVACDADGQGWLGGV